MEKEKEAKRMITESQAYALSATQSSIKVDHSAKGREWSCGKKRTGELLPNYSSKDIYIPEFTNMNLEIHTLQNMLHELTLRKAQEK